jgi:hypothetical protein
VPAHRRRARRSKPATASPRPHRGCLPTPPPGQPPAGMLQIRSAQCLPRPRTRRAMHSAPPRRPARRASPPTRLGSARQPRPDQPVRSGPLSPVRPLKSVRHLGSPGQSVSPARPPSRIPGPLPYSNPAQPVTQWSVENPAGRIGQSFVPTAEFFREQFSTAHICRGFSVGRRSCRLESHRHQSQLSLVDIRGTVLGPVQRLLFAIPTGWPGFSTGT